jgi:hypothetical protein
MSAWIGWGAVCRRRRAAVSICTNWRRRVSNALNACACASGRGRGVGRTASATCASPRASRLSLLAKRPVALATSRAWREFTTTTGRPASARAPAAGPSSPPVASNTIRVGWTVPRRSTRPAIPDSAWLTCQLSSVGRRATSSWAFETSIPTNTWGSLMAVPPPPPSLVRGGLRRSWPRFGLWPGGTSRPGLTHGLSRPEGRRPVTSRVTVIRWSIFTYSRDGIKIQGAALSQGTKGAEVWYDRNCAQAKPGTVAQGQRDDHLSHEGLDHG